MQHSLRGFICKNRCLLGFPAVSDVTVVSWTTAKKQKQSGLNTLWLLQLYLTWPAVNGRDNHRWTLSRASTGIGPHWEIVLCPHLQVSCSETGSQVGGVVSGVVGLGGVCWSVGHLVGNEDSIRSQRWAPREGYPLISAIWWRQFETHHCTRDYGMDRWPSMLVTSIL